MIRGEKKWTGSLRAALLAAAVFEAIGIALAIWKSMAKG
jgi:hypothetical protein